MSYHDTVSVIEQSKRIQFDFAAHQNHFTIAITITVALWKSSITSGPSYIQFFEWFIHLLLYFSNTTNHASTGLLWKLNASKIAKPVCSDYCYALLEMSALPHMCCTVTYCMVLLSNKKNFFNDSWGNVTLGMFTHLWENYVVCVQWP